MLILTFKACEAMFGLVSNGCNFTYQPVIKIKVFGLLGQRNLVSLIWIFDWIQTNKSYIGLDETGHG